MGDQQDFLTIINGLRYLDIEDLATVILLASDHIKKQVNSKPLTDEPSIEKRLDSPLEPILDRKDTEEYDHDDYDPIFVVPTKTELDIDLLRYRMKDPRLSQDEKMRISSEIMNLL